MKQKHKELINDHNKQVYNYCSIAQYKRVEDNTTHITVVIQ